MEIVKEENGQEKKPMSMEEIQQQVLAEQGKQKACWDDLLPVLKKHGYTLSSHVTIADNGQVKFGMSLKPGQPILEQNGPQASGK